MSAVRKSCSAICVLLCLLYSSPFDAQNPPDKSPPVNPDSQIVASFENQVKDYVKLHNQAKSGLPALKRTASADDIEQYEHQLADRIRMARSAAKQGDIFSPDVSREFERLIALSYQGRNATRVRESLRHAEPVTAVRVKVNAAYPERVPLQSTPPSVLLNLPPLPPELDYRIVGHELVLRDVGANLIVDYVPGAIPSS